MPTKLRTKGFKINPAFTFKLVHSNGQLYIRQLSSFTVIGKYAYLPRMFPGKQADISVLSIIIGELIKRSALLDTDELTSTVCGIPYYAEVNLVTDPKALQTATGLATEWLRTKDPKLYDLFALMVVLRYKLGVSVATDVATHVAKSCTKRK